MAGPVELVIVVGAFGLVATYLYIVRQFIRAAEAETAPPQSAKADGQRPVRLATAH